MKPILLIICAGLVLAALPACESERRVTTTTTTEETSVQQPAPAATETRTVRTY